MKKILFALIILISLLITSNNIYAETINSYTDISINTTVNKNESITYYRFELPSNGIITLNNYKNDSNSETLNITITLFDSLGNQIDKNFVVLTSTSYNKILDNGTYYIKVEGDNNISFNILFKEYTFIDSNIISSIDNKYKYSFEDIISSSVNKNKKDYYEIELDNISEITLESISENNLLYFNIYDLNDNLVKEIKQVSLEYRSSILLSKGIYYIEVGIKNNIDTNYTFDIYISKEYDKNVSEPNNSFDTATNINKIIHNVINRDNTIDYYKFTISKDAKVKLHFESIEGFELNIYNSKKERIPGYGYASYTDLNEYIILGKGTYYIKVNKLSEVSPDGGYTLSLGDNKTPVILYEPKTNFTPILETQEGTTAYTKSVQLKIRDTIAQNADKYEIYMSTKSNGTYKLVGTINNKATNTYSVQYFKVNNLKQNTQYFFKIRARKTINGAYAYSNYSTVRNYWTAMPKKVKITSNTSKQIKWKKVKGVTGYIVNEKYNKYVGKNVFFQDVYYRGEKSSLLSSSKTKYKRQYKTKLKSKKTKKSTVTVKAYTKKGNFYIVEGELVTSNKSKYSYNKGEKYL